MALMQRYVPQALSQPGRLAATNATLVPPAMTKGVTSRATMSIAGHPRLRIDTAALIFAHLCLGIAAPYLLLTGFTALGTLFALLLVGMLSADILLAFYQQSWLAWQVDEPGVMTLPRWRFPLRAISVFSCVGIICGALVGIALQGPPALAANANVGMEGKLALLSASANGLTFSPDGNALALETPTGIAIMNHTTGTITRQLAIPAPGFAAGQGPIAIAWNTRWLAATYRVANAGDDAAYAVTAWQVDAGMVQFTAPLDGAVSQLVWSPEGTTLAGYLPPQTAGGFGVIMRWDVATGVSTPPIFITNGLATAQHESLFAWSPDPKYMAVVNDSHTVLIVDLRYSNSSERFIDSHAITALAWSPDGTLLASGHNDGSVSLLDISTLTVKRTIMTQPHAVQHLAWSPDSGRLVFATDTELGVIAVTTPQPLLPLNRPAAAPVTAKPGVAQPGFQSYALVGASPDTAPTVAAVVWSADDAIISARYSDGALVSWDVAAITR